MFAALSGSKNYQPYQGLRWRKRLATDAIMLASIFFSRRPNTTEQVRLR